MKIPACGDSQLKVKFFTLKETIVAQKAKTDAVEPLVATSDGAYDPVTPETADAIAQKYQAVLREPIPPRLSALIQRLKMVEDSREI